MFMNDVCENSLLEFYTELQILLFWTQDSYVQSYLEKTSPVLYKVTVVVYPINCYFHDNLYINYILSLSSSVSIIHYSLVVGVQ